MRQEMSVLSSSTLLPLKQIFDDVCRKYPEAAVYFSFNTIRPTLQRIRSSNKPQIPESLVTLYDRLQYYEPLKNIKINYLRSEIGESAIILTTDTLLQGLSKSKELFVDGTFAVLPKKPRTGQLYTIHMRYMDNGIATILVLCEKRTVTLYTAIWQRIFNLIPELPNNINFIMSDYEAAAVNTLNKLFPNALIHGCWFHYCQAVLRKWRKLGLTNAPNTVVRMTMSLPLLPDTKFQEGLLIIQREADVVSNNFPNILLFMSYMRTTWLKMASRVSVHNCPVRTNNIAESFHNIAGLKVGKQNINIWAFLEKVRDLLIDQELDLKRLQNGVACRRPRAYANINRRKKIAKAQTEYDTGRLSLEEFLRIFNYEDTIFMSNKGGTLADEDINDEIADPNYFAETTDDQTEKERMHRRRSRRTVSNTTLMSSNSSKAEDRKTEYIEEELPGFVHFASKMQAETRKAKIQDANTNVHSYSSNSLTDSSLQIFVENDIYKSQQCIAHYRTENRQNEQNFNDEVVTNANDTYNWKLDTYLASDTRSPNRLFVVLRFSSLSETYAMRSRTHSKAFTATISYKGNIVICEILQDNFWKHNRECENHNGNKKKDIGEHTEGHCIMCFINKATEVFVPCGHLATCLPCIKQCSCERCPICNVNVMMHVTLRKS